MARNYVSEDQICRITGTLALPRLRYLCPPLAMSDLEGNFDVIILGTGLVESIAAA